MHDPTLISLAQRYVAERGLSASTGRDVELVLGALHTKYQCKRVSQFKDTDLVAFVSRTGLAPSTQARYRSVLVNFFEWAAWRGLCDGKAAVGLKHLHRVKAQPSRVHTWLTPEQGSAVLAACEDGTPVGRRDRTLILVAVFTGLRRNELAGLTWGQVDLTAQTITVVGKGNKLAVIGFNNQVREALFTWKAEGAKALGGPQDPSNPVFPRARNYGLGVETPGVRIEWLRAISRNGIANLVARRGEAAGVRLRPHDLRRSFAGWLEERAGGDLSKVQKALRHSNVGTTQKYLESNPRKVVEIGQSFDLAL